MVELEQFWEQLNGGPAVLFLGQSYLRSETGSDPLLIEAQTRFGGDATTSGYDLLLEGTASDSGQSALAWLSERCRRLSPPQWLHSVAAFPWSSVFSSAIDPLWLPSFRNEWREVAPIYDDEYYPTEPRNRRVLHCTYLFGSLNSTEERERPPLTAFEFLSRKQIANNLLQRISSTVTPMGVLAIEGYSGDGDWTSLEDLFPVMQTLGPSQIHLFSVDELLAAHPIVAELVRSGTMIAHSESLAWVLEQGFDNGLIHPEAISQIDSDGRRVTLRHTSIRIPRELWNRITVSATLIDDEALAPPPRISYEATYWEFRRFLFETGTRPLWSGFARGFAFRRDFETGLLEVVLNRMSRAATVDQPIVIHGQTGTGKTMALGSLAYGVAKSGQYPVLFLERRTQRPIYSDIDECCRWLEDNRAQATLIIWDGMVQPSDYHELQGHLASRGRSAVVVGSSYHRNEENPNLIRVPDRLSVHEAQRFTSFLEEMGLSVSERHREALARRDPSYLVALYRYLAPARRRISTGVVQELEQLEQEFVAAVNQHEMSVAEPTSLAIALREAGLIDDSVYEGSRLRADTEITTSEVAELVDIVTVPGRFGINIPIELLARTWGKPNLSGITHVLRSFDLIHASEDSAGRVAVGPRHSLEARLIVQARLGSVEKEAAIVSRIIKSMRPWNWGADESDEVSFVIELLRAVGPQGGEQSRFAPFFRDVAVSISEVRKSRNIRSPRIMLQEANFLREWVTIKSRLEGRPADASNILKTAQTTLHEALELLHGNRQWRLRTYIATELASIYGAATIDSINAGANMEEVAGSYRQVLNAVNSARAINFSTYNPVDVLVWSTTAFLDSDGVDPVTRAEALSDVLDALETVDPDLLDSGQLNLYHRRRYEIGKVLGDDALSTAAFESLEQAGSVAGYYIRAFEIGGALPNRHFATDYDEQKDPYEAWQFLERHRQVIKHDARCLNLLFDYWWLYKTGHRLFDREHVLLNYQEGDWQYITRLIGDLRETDNSRRGLNFSYLEAIAFFHLEQIPQALQLFREVESESYMVSGRRRVLRSFVASEPGGHPRKFHGTVRRVQDGGHRAEVSVEELRQSIIFFPHEFGRPEIRGGDSLGEFHIAFNFIGPIAEPPARTELRA